MFNFIFNSSMVTFAFELIFAVVPFSVRLEKRNNFTVKLILSVIISLGLIIFYSNLIFFDDDVTAVKYGVFCFTIFIIYVFDLQIIFNVKFKEALFAVTCAYLVEHMAYCIRELINYITETNISTSGEVLYYIIHFSVYILGYFIFARNMIMNKHYISSVLQSLWLTLMTLSLVLFMSLVAYLNSFIWLHSIYALFACFVVLISQVHHLKQLKLERDLNFTNQLRKSQSAQYKLSKEAVEIINSKSHDLKHFVSALKVASDKGDFSSVISSMEESVNTYDSILNTGNEILDTIITEKSLISSTRNIKLIPTINGDFLTFMDAVDLYTMLGNALDNSIEACMEISDPDKKFISVKINNRAGLTFIVIENYTNIVFESSKHLPKTTKKDKISHGFGLKSIKSIAEKYNGFINIKTINCVFTLEITMPYQL